LELQVGDVAADVVQKINRENQSGCSAPIPTLFKDSLKKDLAKFSHFGRPREHFWKKKKKF
jgi:hypothetical protein